MTAPGDIQVRERMVRLLPSRAVAALHNAELARDVGDIHGIKSRLVSTDDPFCEKH
jgi:hypothetical protein